MADSRAPVTAIIGAETLVARELRELLGALRPSPEVRLLSGEAGSVKLARDEEGEAIVLAPFDRSAFEDAKVVFLAGAAESSSKALELASEAGTRIIDLTGALEDHPRARLRAPQLEDETRRPDDAIHVVAHPAAVTLAIFFRRLYPKFGVERCLVEIFEPASERGKAGLKELQAQTVNLLSFKPLPKAVFDAQLGFNLLAAYGEDAPHGLDRTEAMIDRHLTTLLLISSGMAVPSLRLIQAPVFHGHSFSVWMEFSGAPGAAAIEEALASAQIDVRRSGEEPPNNVAAAGESGLIVGGIRADRNHPRAFWFWLVSDNLRTMAETAVAVAREYL